jgi:hypothetical protein
MWLSIMSCCMVWTLRVVVLPHSPAKKSTVRSVLACVFGIPGASMS